MVIPLIYGINYQLKKIVNEFSTSESALNLNHTESFESILQSNRVGTSQTDHEDDAGQPDLDTSQVQSQGRPVAVTFAVNIDEALDTQFPDTSNDDHHIS